MSWVAAAVVGSAALGAVSSNKAAKAQQKSADAAIAAETAAQDKAEALQREMYYTNRADNAQWLDTGRRANQSLAYGMGLAGAPGGSTQTLASMAAPRESEQQIRARLLAQYTSAGTPGTPAYAITSPTQQPGMVWNNVGREDGGYWSTVGGPSAIGPGSGQMMPATAAIPGTVDEAGLSAAIQAEMARQGAVQPGSSDQGGGSSAYGGGTTPWNDFNRDFTLADFNKDPGYDFRMKEGTRAVEGSAAARGSLLSGGTLKALTRYGQDMGSQEYKSAYDRFNEDRTRRFNRLSSLSGTGQTASNAVSSAGSSMANNISSGGLATAARVGDNLIGAGNARASGYVGTANAVAGGASDLINQYQQNQLLNKLTPKQQPEQTYGPSSYGSFGIA